MDNRLHVNIHTSESMIAESTRTLHTLLILRFTRYHHAYHKRQHTRSATDAFTRFRKVLSVRCSWISFFSDCWDTDPTYMAAGLFETGGGHRECRPKYVHCDEAVSNNKYFDYNISSSLICDTSHRDLWPGVLIQTRISRNRPGRYIRS